MVKNHTHKPSALEQVHIAFEYDITWQDAKKAIRRRTDTK
jgi:hypothetical protein